MWSRAVAAVVVLVLAIGAAAEVETVFAELTDGDHGELQLTDAEMKGVVRQLFVEIMREGYADADTNILDRDNDSPAAQAADEAAAGSDFDTVSAADHRRFAAVDSKAKTNTGMTQKVAGFFNKLKNAAKAAMKVAGSAGGALGSIGKNLIKGLGKGLTSKLGKKLLKKVAKKAGQYLGEVGHFAARMAYRHLRANVPRLEVGKEAGDVEDCVACRYVWFQVEMDVGGSVIEDNIYDAFHANALEAQKTGIFYPACQTMFDSIDDMLADYLDGYTVDQLCENSMLCR